MAERKSFLLRIRPELYEALQRWAQDEFRSLNGQVEYLLDQAVRRAGRHPAPRPGAAGGGTREDPAAGEEPEGSGA